MNSFYKVMPCKNCANKTPKPTVKGLCQYHYRLHLQKKSVEKRKKKILSMTDEYSSDYEFFETIFSERQPVCFITNTKLKSKEYYEKKGNFHWLFHHVLPKSIYPKFRYYKNNVILVLPEIHDRIETMALSDLIKENKNYEKLKSLITILKQEYNGR